jgi:hypothetical protein
MAEPNEPIEEKEIKPQITKTEKESTVTNEPILEAAENLNDNPKQDEERKEPLSSLDILWQNAFRELDEWAAHADFRDEVFLRKAIHYVESIKRNQGSLMEVTEQFNREFREWEKAARDEFLMSTTTLQHFFPIRSYEEINQQIDLIQQRTLSILAVPCQAVSSIQLLDKYEQMIEQYIYLRKKSRLQYIKMIKQASNLVYENQKGFINLFSKQIKSFIFPFNKYLEKTEELTKS